MGPNAQIDEAGNDPMAWVHTSGDLLCSRDTLAKQRIDAEEAAKANGTPRRVTPQERSYWVEVMLIGFAVENLLKALFVIRGNPMYADGKLKPIAGAKNHDLVSIATRVGFLLSDPERKDLTMLSEIMTGVGRYPLAPRPSSRGLPESWGDDSDTVVEKLVVRLRSTIKNENA